MKISEIFIRLRNIVAMRSKNNSYDDALKPFSNFHISFGIILSDCFFSFEKNLFELLFMPKDHFSL